MYLLHFIYIIFCESDFLEFPSAEWGLDIKLSKCFLLNNIYFDIALTQEVFIRIIFVCLFYCTCFVDYL